MSTQLKNKIRKCVRYWIPIVGLQNWELVISFDEPRHLATAYSNPKYLSCHIKFNLDSIKDNELGDEGISQLVLHELVHPLIYELARGRDGHDPEPMVEYLEEVTVTAVTHAIWRAHGGVIQNV